jgi:hypothetical protein
LTGKPSRRVITPEPNVCQELIDDGRFRYRKQYATQGCPISLENNGFTTAASGINIFDTLL